MILLPTPSIFQNTLFRLSELSDTQKNKTLNVATLANKFCWTSLLNTDLNTWIAGSHIYKTIFFLE